MLDVVLLESKRFGIDLESLGNQRRHVAHRLLTTAQADEVQNPGGIGEGVLNFLSEVRVAVLTYSHVVDVCDLGTDKVQASLNRKRGKTRIVLDAVQALFGNGEYDLAILHQCSRGVTVKHVQSQDQHWRWRLPRFNSVLMFSGIFRATNMSKGAQWRHRCAKPGKGLPRGRSFSLENPACCSNRSNSSLEY